MTVQPEQIAKAREHGLTNVEHLAAACDKIGLPFFLACTILQKETGGLNIYGHDVGGVFTVSGRKEVTEENFAEFRRRIDAGERSNGVGPMQITWKGFFPDAESQGLKLWLPADNILYGVQILARTWKSTGGDIFKVGKAYNGADSYGRATVELAKTWKARVGTVDTEPPPPPPPQPSNVGHWLVDPDKVTTRLRGRDKDGNVVAPLEPGAVITDGVRFEFNWVGRIALWTAAGVAYEREYLTQVAAGPVPVPVTPTRPLPAIPVYEGTERLRFRGGRTCICVATSLPWVEYRMLEAGIIRFNIDIYQLGYRDNVEASKGTHARGGNTDVGQYSEAALKVWREMGWAMQDRSPFFADDHGHGWPAGCPHLSPAAEKQEDAWRDGRNGLVNDGRIMGPNPKGALTRRWDEALTDYKDLLDLEERPSP